MSEGSCIKITSDGFKRQNVFIIGYIPCRRLVICMKFMLMILYLFAALVFITGICDSITPGGNVSINGLYFSDTGCSKCSSGFDLTMLNPTIYVGMFEFHISKEEHDKNDDVMRIQKSGLFDKRLDEITYYNISHTEISGWPALVGVVEHKNPFGNNTDAIGFIYVDNLTIKFDIMRSFNLADLPKILDRIEITRADTKNMSWEIDTIAKIIPNEVSRNGLHVYPGQLSNSWGGCARWSDKELTLFCGQPDLTMTVKYPGRAIDLDEDKARLTELITKGISNSSITYFNVTETELGGWPAVVAIMNSTVNYISGISDPPLIRVMARVYVGNLTILMQSDTVWEQLTWDDDRIILGDQPEEVYEKLKSIKITIEPGAEQEWMRELSR